MNFIDWSVDDHRTFALILSLHMASDPSPLSREDDARLGRLLDRWSVGLGYDGWVEAYHLHEPDRQVDPPNVTRYVDPPDTSPNLTPETGSFGSANDELNECVHDWQIVAHHRTPRPDRNLYAAVACDGCDERLDIEFKAETIAFLADDEVVR